MSSQPEFNRSHTGSSRESLTDRSDAGPSVHSPKKSGGFWRAAVEDAKYFNETELPNKKEQTNDAIRKIQELLSSDSIGNIAPVITNTNNIKDWVRDHQRLLNLSQKDYERMRSEYLENRKAYEKKSSPSDPDDAYRWLDNRKEHLGVVIPRELARLHFQPLINYTHYKNGGTETYLEQFVASCKRILEIIYKEHIIPKEVEERISRVEAKMK